MNPAPSLSLDELQPAPSSPDFDPAHVIMVIDLPRIQMQDCASVPLEHALEVIAEISTRLRASRSQQDIDGYRQQLDAAIAAAKTPIIKFWADEQSARIDVFAATTRTVRGLKV